MFDDDGSHNTRKQRTICHCYFCFCVAEDKRNYSSVLSDRSTEKTSPDAFIAEHLLVVYSCAPKKLLTMRETFFPNGSGKCVL